MAAQPVLTVLARKVRLVAWVVLLVATVLGLRMTPAAQPGPGATLQPLALADLIAPAWPDPETGWRISTLRSHPGILVLEFPSLAEQGAALNRTAALIEKAGAPRDRLLDDGALARFIAETGSSTATFLYGHDYAAMHLARVFNLARQQGLGLGLQEQRLRSLLVQQRLLSQDPSGLWLGDSRRALVTVSQVQADDPTTPDDDSLDEDLRAAMLRHELSHGVYFVDAAYREACRALWVRLSETHRAGLKRHFAALGYDPQDEDLMINETQAFLMHTPAPYGLDGRALGLEEAVLESWRQTLATRAGRSLPLHRFQ